MEEIHEFLLSNGWIDLKYGEYMSKDGIFKIAVLYDEEDKGYNQNYRISFIKMVFK